MSEVSAAGLPPVIVFVVDDEILIHDLLRDPLEEAGYSVLVAATGAEAIKALEGDKADEIKALVTDVNLGPKSASGWDVARRARELQTDIPVVYVTGDSGHEWASQGVPNSMLIKKPFAPAQVVTAVSQLINNASSGSPASA
jgi:DNA-binding response OmpR family regulator